ncbi:MAG: hypothetical protein EOO43_16965, partial [Flavobacterium sp.]
MTIYKGIDFNVLLPEFHQVIDTNLRDSQINEVHENIVQNIALLDKTLNTNKINSAYNCDTPPSNTYWVGRKSELDILEESSFKACFITGIGGQGKSGLAAHFISSKVINQYDYWDWRDCKEEDNRFITIIISIVERLTNGKYRSYQLARESVSGIINLFFEELGDKKALFVFDNIDNYIDLVNFYPSRGIKELLNKVLSNNHNSKFLFTCRPCCWIRATGTG